MNKFKKLADKLLKIKLWTSEITLIQLVQGKDEKGRIIYVDDLVKDVNCVKNEYTEKIENDKFDHFTDFYVSMKFLEGYDLKGKFAIIYNGQRYFPEEVRTMGTICNEDTLANFVVKR